MTTGCDRFIGNKILVVEDHVLVATYVTEILSEAGYEVVGVAASGPAALSLAEESRPSLALVDIQLIGPFDGIELACLLRYRYSVPTIFLSGLIDVNIVERARVASPLGFLQKPFRPGQVFNAVDHALIKMIW